MRLVFLDTETTSLRHDRRAWEIGLIWREDGRESKPHRWFIDSADLDLGNADPRSLDIGGFYKRHPSMGGLGGSYREHEALTEVERLTRKATLVGAVPNFDADVLASRMRAHGICPSWHYHLIDVEALAVGYLAAKNAWGTGVEPLLPWRSDDLAQALGVEVRGEERHTALGDVRVVRDIYDTVMGLREVAR